MNIDYLKYAKTKEDGSTWEKSFAKRIGELGTLRSKMHLHQHKIFDALKIKNKTFIQSEDRTVEQSTPMTNVQISVVDILSSK